MIDFTYRVFMHDYSIIFVVNVTCLPLDLAISQSMLDNFTFVHVIDLKY